MSRRPEALALLSGVLLAMSLPKFGHGAVAWFALAPVLLAIGLRGGQRAARLGYLTGASSSVGLLYWTATVIVQFGGLAQPLAVAAMVLLCLVLAVYPLLFAWMTGRWVRALGPRGLLLAPIAWVATEILRAHTLWSFAWCLLGTSQHDQPALLQIARWGAVYAVSFAVVVPSAAISCAVFETSRRTRFAVLGGAAGFVVAVWSYGLAVLARPLPSGPSLRVALIQPSILQQDRWVPGLAWENIGRHLALTEQAADQGAQLVVWSESSVPGYWDRDAEVRRVLEELARRRRIWLLFGNDDREQHGPDRRDDQIYVGAKMIDPEGVLRYRYHKMRLVPFGEFVPMEPLLSLIGAQKIVDEVASFVPGSEHTLATMPEGRLGGFICYEAIFPDHVAQFVRNGANLLVNITNDAWYGFSSAPYQHLAMARLRAVETGRYLVRAANTGISAVVDPRGRIVSRLGLFETGLLIEDVPLLSAPTPYTRHGDVFAWACLVAAAGLTAASFRARPPAAGRIEHETRVN